MSFITSLGNLEFLGNPLSRWAWAVLAFVVTFTILPLIHSYASALAQRTRGRLVVAELILRLIPRTRRWFLLVAALYFAGRFLTFPGAVHRALTVLIVVGFWYQVGRWSTAAVEFFTERHTARDLGAKSSLAIIRFLAAVLVWSFVLLLALDNLDVNVTTLVTGLGIGGIAIALAVQAILGDLLASLSIALDKPFVIGDQLLIDGFHGSVEHIGIKSTRLRSVTGEQIILSNADILKSRVRNFGRMDERRAVLNIGIAYETPRDKIPKAVELIKGAIAAQANVRLDRCHFKNFGASALEFEAVFFVLDAKLNALMDAQQAILLKILGDFAAHDIEFAYPTQRVLLAGAMADNTERSESPKAERRIG